MTIRRVLIYRLGSLGDTMVALPAFHLIARSFPKAERRVLTNFPSGSKESPLSAVLDGAGLVHGYMAYPLKLRSPRQLNNLRRRVKQWKPDILIYLAEPRGRVKAFRDALFFRSCGIRTLIGVPYSRSLQENHRLNGKRYYEPEAARLLRCLSSLADGRLDDLQSWDLRLTMRERARAKQALHSFKSDLPFIACSIGTKVDVKDWGQKNWKILLRQLSQKYKNYGLVLIGSEDEFGYNEEVSRSWAGPKLNLCGMLTPRESAGVLKMAKIFVGHDSGPMHLAASVRTPCVAIFSARNKPRVWFPYGHDHQVIYHKTECYGCGLEVCKREAKKCIASITVKEVEEAVHTLLLSLDSSISS